MRFKVTQAHEELPADEAFSSEATERGTLVSLGEACATHGQRPRCATVRCYEARSAALAR